MQDTITRQIKQISPGVTRKQLHILLGKDLFSSTDDIKRQVANSNQSKKNN